jgi:hypothetical protein
MANSRTTRTIESLFFIGYLLTLGMSKTQKERSILMDKRIAMYSVGYNYFSVKEMFAEEGIIVR